MAIVKVGLIQMSCTADVQANKAKAIEKIKATAKQGAQIVCLQELYTSLYFCDVEAYENFKLAEPIPGKTTDELALLAKELNIVIIASLFEKRAEGLYHNTTAVLDADGTYLGKYRKMHITDDPAYYEKFYFTPGDLGHKDIKTKFANWCFDLLGSVVSRSCKNYKFNGCRNVILSNSNWLGYSTGRSN